MDDGNGKDKGKAIADESDVNSPKEDVSNHEATASGSITGETSSPAPRPNNNNSFGYLPPLAHQYVYGNGGNRNIRPTWVSFPAYRGFYWMAPCPTMFHGFSTRVVNLPAPRPILSASYFRPVYVIRAPPPFMVYRYPNPRAIYFPYPRYYVNNHGEGTSAQGALAQGNVDWSEAPIEERSLFFTFSRGDPLTEQEIFWYFAVRYGIRNVEGVDIHHPREEPPSFGRIVFTTPAIPMTILNGRSEERIIINDKSIVCKKYMPKQHRAMTTENASS